MPNVPTCANSEGNTTALVCTYDFRLDSLLNYIGYDSDPENLRFKTTQSRARKDC